MGLHNDIYIISFATKTEHLKMDVKIFLSLLIELFYLFIEKMLRKPSLRVSHLQV